MARTMAGSPDGTRVTDHLSLGVVTKAFPLPLIRRILSDTARTSQRERELPAPVMVYYVIALALYMQVSSRVRVIEYTLPGVPDAEPSYRVVTTLLDPDTAPAVELAALSHERGAIETACDALKTHLRGARIVLRSKTPDLVRQEAYGLLLAHFAVRVLRRTLPRVAALPP